MDLLTAADIAGRARAEHLHPQAIILFGSVAKGTSGPYSDLDFLIVASREAGERQDLLNQCRDAIGKLPVPVDFLVYYPDEVAAKRDRCGSVVREALRTGRVMHGSV